MLLASNPISSAAQPLFKFFAEVLAFFYSIVPNYAVAIALLTVAVMIVVFPITRRGTRSMMRMQIYQPELKKLQLRYKAPPGATPAEKTELRQRQQEEMMAFYKENNISPTGGCLPMIIQLPIFWILYGTIKGLVHTTTKVVHGAKLVVADPLYISHTSRLYRAIAAANQHPAKNGIRLDAFGLNLADSVRTGGLALSAKIPFVVMILVAVGLQYVQMKQLSGRNPAARQANPQMAQMQKFFPIIFAVIYIAIPAGVNVYFIVSSLFRIGQQEFMYRRDPQLQESLRQLRERHAKSQQKGGGSPPAKGAPARPNDPTAPAAPDRPKGLLGRLGVASALTDQAAIAGAGAGAGPGAAADSGTSTARPGPRGRSNTGGRTGTGSGSASGGAASVSGSGSGSASGGAANGNGSGARRKTGSSAAKGASGEKATDQPRNEGTSGNGKSGRTAPPGGSGSGRGGAAAKVPGSPLARQRPAAPNGSSQPKPRSPSRAQGGKRTRRPR